MVKIFTNKWIFFFGSLIFLLSLWEYVARTFSHLQFILPPPSEIMFTLCEMRDRFWLHTIVTLKEMLSGFFLALCCAFPLAWTMMRFQATRTLLQPLFIIIQCIPMFTLAPIMVIWCGWGPLAIIIPTALMIFFPLTLNIYQGLRSTPTDLLEFFESNQATVWQTFFKLQLPWAVPHVFAGFRISSAIAGVSAVAGEWAGAQNGLGVLMLESRRNTDLAITFAALFCLVLMSTSLYLIILYSEKILLPPRQWTSIRLFKRLHSKKRFALSILTFILGSQFLIGCHKKDESTQTRLMLDWHPNPNHIPLYVGLDKGYFKEMGIELIIQKMHESGSGISYLTGRKADILINHMPGALKACERGAKIKMIGTLIKEPLCGLIYRQEGSIQKPSDLSGRIFGYCIGIPDIDFLEFLLEKGDIKPSEKKNVSVDLVASMGTKSVDFIYGGFWNIEPAQLKAVNIETNVFKIQELGVPMYYEMILLANEDSLCATPSYINNFQHALQKSLDYCTDHPDDAFNIYVKYNLDRRAKTNTWQKEAWELTHPLLAHDQTVDRKLIKRFCDWQMEQGILEKTFDYQDLLP